MTAILSQPFRVLSNGNVATVEQNSDQGNAEQIGVLASTYLGERPLSPGFGVTDPTFGSLHPSEVLAGLSLFGPPVEVSDIRASWESDSTQLITIDFD